MRSAQAGGAAAMPTHSRNSAARHSRFLQQRVEETVMPSIREQLASGQLAVVVDRGKAQASRVPMAFQETGDLLAVLLLEHGTSCVQQFTTTGQGLPQRVEQARLRARELRDVGRAPQPLDIRMPPDDARGAARHVGEYAIVGPAVPPLPRLAGIAARYAPLQSQAREIRAHPLE